MKNIEETMNELIEKLSGIREEALANYLVALDGYSPETGSMDAVKYAGYLHDLDKHITNLNSELSRIEAEEALNRAADLMQEVSRG